MTGNRKNCSRVLILFIYAGSVSFGGLLFCNEVVAQDRRVEGEKMDGASQDLDSILFDALDGEYNSRLPELDFQTKEPLDHSPQGFYEPFIRVSLNIWAMSPTLFESKGNRPQGARVTNDHKGTRRVIPSGLMQLDLNLHSMFSIRGVFQYLSDESTIQGEEGLFAGIDLPAQERRVRLERTSIEGHLVVHMFRTNTVRVDLLAGALYDRLVFQIEQQDQIARRRFESAMPTLGIGVLYEPLESFSAYLSVIAGHIGETDTRETTRGEEQEFDRRQYSDEYEDIAERSMTVFIVDLSVRYKLTKHLGLLFGVRANYIEYDYSNKTRARDQLKIVSIGPQIGLFTEF